MARSLLVGLATGLRSQAGLAVVLRRSEGGLPLVGSPLFRRLSSLALAGELVADKVPGVPSRLDRGPLTARALLGALAAAQLARVRERRLLPAALLGAIGALGAAHLGHDLRAAYAQRSPEVGVAFSEDAIAIFLALVATTGLRTAHDVRDTPVEQDRSASAR